MQVRLAVKADVPRLMALGRMLYKENAISGWAEDKIREAVDHAIAGNKSLIGVIGPVGEPVAMIHLFVGQFWYTHDCHLEEIYNFVHPSHRRSDYAQKLIDFAKLAAQQLGIPLLIGVVSNQRTEAKIRLYRRKLGDPSGAYFLWNKTTGK